MVRIRILDASELNLWTTLRLAALADAPDAFGDTAEQALRRTEKEWQDSLLTIDGELYIAEHDGFPIGMARVSRSTSRSSSSGLYSMWVAPSARGKGVGEMLIEAAFAWAAKVGVDKMELLVTQENDSARRLYLAKGFVDTERLRQLRPGSELRMQAMTKRLSNRSESRSSGDSPPIKN